MYCCYTGTRSIWVYLPLSHSMSFGLLTHEVTVPPDQGSKWITSWFFGDRISGSLKTRLGSREIQPGHTYNIIHRSITCMLHKFNSSRAEGDFHKRDTRQENERNWERVRESKKERERPWSAQQGKETHILASWVGSRFQNSVKGAWQCTAKMTIMSNSNTSDGNSNCSRGDGTVMILLLSEVAPSDLWNVANAGSILYTRQDGGVPVN